MKYLQILCLSLLTVFSIGQVAGAEIVYDNMAGGASGIDNGFSSDLQTGFLQADDFTLASTTTVTGIQWTGFYAGTAQTAPALDAFTISIIADSAGSPVGGEPLGIFNVGNDVNRQDAEIALFGGAVPIYEYEAAIDFTFDAGTNYWVSIATDTTNDVEDNFFWGGQVNQGNHYFSQNGGDTWAPGANPDGSRLDFRLTTVPEPTSALLFCLGAAFAVAKRRRSFREAV